MQAGPSLRRIKNFLKHAGMALEPGPTCLTLLAQGGSDRRFYRITEKGLKVLDKRPGAKKPYQPAEPPAPPSEAFLG